MSMNAKSEKEYTFDEFLKKFFSTEEEKRKVSLPYEIGISISTNALANMNKSIKETRESYARKKRKESN